MTYCTTLLMANTDHTCTPDLTSVFSHHGNPENIVTAMVHSSPLQILFHSFTTEVSLIAELQFTIQLLMELLKDSIEPSEANHNPQPWKEIVMNWFQVYSAAPHATTVHTHLLFDQERE